MLATPGLSSKLPIDPIEVLLVEDDDDDVRLITRSLANDRLLVDLNRVEDGLEAMSYLRHEGQYADAKRPDLILLDLNMPRLDGRGVLSAVKSDPDLKQIPIVVLTSSDDEKDILSSYTHQANSYVTKPVDLQQFHAALSDVQRYWFCIVKLPDTGE